MSDRDRGRIVVGVDGSPSSTKALRWALRQAAATNARVSAVQAWQTPGVYGTVITLVPGEELAAAARESLDAVLAAADADADAPDVEVDRRVVGGHPARVLLEEAEDADLLVVGSRGHGGVVGSLIGSVSQYCINHASCPVVVVRDTE
ncbi:universal stress protein [Glycomyces tenuis]|uniref:universal stress protein n=2 Tax=Glycomyces tenuis TaxID=58116 RepID=UPI000403BE73|nr:universal stress protein [Glycomyces tenuis]